MKCQKCDADITDGSLYCGRCGHEVELVPTYIGLFDDLNESIKEGFLKEKEPLFSDVINDNTFSQKTVDLTANTVPSAPSSVSRKKVNKINYSIYPELFLAFTLIFIMIAIIIKTKHANSFEYQLDKAQAAYYNGDFESSLRYVSRVLELDSASSEGNIIKAQIYIEEERYDIAASILRKALDTDPSNPDIYHVLISIYKQQENYEEIKELFDNTSDSVILELYKEYIPNLVEFSLVSGTYEKSQELTLKSTNSAIYYTLDGTTPTTESALYKQPITLEGGTIIVKAISYNNKGIPSDVVSQAYEITTPNPAAPSVSHVSGSYSTNLNVTIFVPGGCTVYYTLDGSIPTENSSIYSGAISLSKGPYTLSAIIVDKYGKYSDVTTCFYTIQ